MAKKAAVVKVLAWKNPSPILERWDLELVREDGTRERAIDIGDRAARELASTAVAALRARRRTRDGGERA